MKIFAHRGASKEVAENSLGAFRAALEIGVDAVELDCFLNRAGEVVITHDLENISNPGLPTLKEALELIRPSNASVIFDIKAQGGLYQALAKAVATLAQEFLPPERILLSSFYWRHLFCLKKYFPHLPRALIISRKPFKLVPPALFDKLFSLQAVHIGYWLLDERFIEKWRQTGKKVHAWTINRPEEMKRCKKMGVDGIFTDDPRLAKKIIYG